MTLIPLLLAVLIFGLMLVLHELGHFIIAKHYKIPVSEFAVGVGPTLFKKKIGETTYMINAIPMGGYNVIDDVELDKRPLKQKNVLFFMGAGFNFITAFIACVIASIIVGNNPITEYVGYFTRTFQALFMLVTGQFGSDEMGGYGMMFSTMSNILTQPTVIQTTAVFLRLFAVLSVYIGIFNLLPIYPLDGGRIIVDTVNNYRKDTFKPRFLNAMGFVVFGLLASFNLILTIKDILTM